MSITMEAPAAPPATVPLIGRCVFCKQAFRVEVLATMAAMYRRSIGQALRASGVDSPWCDCRAATPCATAPAGRPRCDNPDCTGHPRSAVAFKIVRVTYKAEKTCGGACWAAKGDGCTCSCRGANHGGMWGR
jgi:hypothetical protein